MPAVSAVVSTPVKFLLRLLAWAGQHRLLAFIFSFAVKRLSATDGPLRILCLSPFRNMVDYGVLGSSDELAVFGLDAKAQDLMVSLCVSEGQDKKRKQGFTAEEDRAIMAFMDRFVPVFLERLKIDAVTAPNPYYRRDIFFVRAVRNTSAAAISFFKEAFYADYYPEVFINHLRRPAENLPPWEFAMVANEHARELLKKIHVIPDQNIHTCGILRLDSLLGLPKRPMPERRTVTLFSFTHNAGGNLCMEEEFWGGCVRESEDECFVRLFNEVHLSMMHLAMRRPEHDFVIKMLWEDPFRPLLNALAERNGIDLAAIPNLKLVAANPTYWLQNSQLVIGFGSTVVLEGIAANADVLMPLFDGARYNDAYYQYIPLHNKLFPEDIARSLEEFEARIIDVLTTDKAPSYREKYAGLLQEYNNFPAPRALEEHVKVLASVVRQKRAG